MSILPGIRASLAQSLANADPALAALQVNKQLSGTNLGLYPADFPSPSALQANLGVQRQIARDFVSSADLPTGTSSTLPARALSFST